MKAVTLIKYGTPDKAFEIRETDKPSPNAGEVLVKVEAFGLNYADVMARNGLYQDAPKNPAVIGYDVVGRLEELGEGVTGLEVGQRVTAMTRFGGYAEYATTDARAIAVIGDEMDNGIGASLTTQGCTAYYAAMEMVNLFEGDHVLIQAAAGGVGTTLVQIAKHKGCIVYGTAGSDEKLEYLRSQGVDHPINYNKDDFYTKVRSIRGDEGINVAFDSVGGETFDKSRKLLAHGGRIVGYGAAQRSEKGNEILSGIKLMWQFGLLHPVGLIQNCKGVIGVNMLRIADHQPDVLKRCLEGVVKMVQEGILKPHVGGRFKATDIAAAHELLGGRKSMGKVIVEW